MEEEEYCLKCVNHKEPFEGFCPVCNVMVCSECDCITNGHNPRVLKSLLGTVKGVLENKDSLECYKKQANLLKELYKDSIKIIKRKEIKHIHNDSKSINKKLEEIEESDRENLENFLISLKEYKKAIKTTTLKNRVEEGIKLLKNTDDLDEEIQSLKTELEKKKKKS